MMCTKIHDIEDIVTYEELSVPPLLMLKSIGPFSKEPFGTRKKRDYNFHKHGALKVISRIPGVCWVNLSSTCDIPNLFNKSHMHGSRYIKTDPSQRILKIFGSIRHKEAKTSHFQKHGAPKVKIQGVENP